MLPALLTRSYSLALCPVIFQGIVNGWANPLLNRVRILLSLVGILASEPPTTVSRNERAAMEKEAELANAPKSEAAALLAEEK